MFQPETSGKEKKKSLAIASHFNVKIRTAAL